MDAETANLVVKIYYKIRELQRLLAAESSIQSAEILVSGAKLYALMNSAFEESSKGGLSLKLNALVAYLSFALASLESHPNNHSRNQISNLFTELSADILCLQSKIIAEM